MPEAVWDDQVPENFKPLPLISFDDKTDPQEDIIAQFFLMRGSDRDPSKRDKEKGLSCNKEYGGGYMISYEWVRMFSWQVSYFFSSINSEVDEL